MVNVAGKPGKIARQPQLGQPRLERGHAPAEQRTGLDDRAVAASIALRPQTDEIGGCERLQVVALMQRGRPRHVGLARQIKKQRVHSATLEGVQFTRGLGLQGDDSGKEVGHSVSSRLAKVTLLCIIRSASGNYIAARQFAGRLNGTGSTCNPIQNDSISSCDQARVAALARYAAAREANRIVELRTFPASAGFSDRACRVARSPADRASCGISNDPARLNRPGCAGRRCSRRHGVPLRWR